MRSTVSRLRPKPGLFWTIASTLVLLQFVGFVLYSWYLYRRFDLLEDFAHNAQAWYLIGHGTLLPLDTIRIPSTPFLRDHFDLVMWPLSLLHFLSGSPFWLLVVQDLAVVLAELITLRWVWRLITDHLDQHQTVAGLLALVVLMANAWWYETVSFDVHLTPLGLPVLVLVGYWLTEKRWLRAGIAAGACVLFGAVVTELLVFVGLGSLLVLLAGRPRPRHRRGLAAAAAITVGAGAWVLVVTGAGANQASNLASQYAYLVADNGHAGTFALLSGVLRHPVRAWHMLRARAHAMARPLITSGIVGIASPVGLLVSIGTLVPAGLAVSPSFSSVNDSFQTLAVVPFVLIGDVMVLLWLGRRWAAAEGDSPGVTSRPRPRRRAAVVWGLACVLALVALTQDARLLIHLRQTWWTVSPAAAAALKTALDQAPPATEVISSNGVIGRFSQRHDVYPLQLSPQTVPVKASRVVLVIATAGNEALTRAQVSADVRFVRDVLHARPLSTAPGVATFAWTAPPGGRNVTFP